jgi:alpha-amylase
MSHLTLCLVIHNHQPVGNFHRVFEDATRKAYDPMLDAVERHPEVRLAFHYSGPLLDWLLANRPDHLKRLADLVAREQVELLTGAYYEPILVAIPDVDKLGQLNKMTAFLRERFGASPTGAWIAERVWEPHLPKPLDKAGIRYTLLDDTAFHMIGLGGDELFGPYVTEEHGAAVKVFSNLTYLRYTIPWRPVEHVLDWLRQQAESHPGGVAVFGDDGEKFGFWSGAWQHCWGENAWVDRFFTALEDNADWLQTRPLGEVAVESTALGRVYLPPASYEEMMHWALPPQASVDFGRALRAGHRPDHQDAPYAGGGMWRSFLRRYDEINHMHKKMLWVGRKVHRMSPGNTQAKALDHLWSAQCSCAYWHGLFGGIYLFHIRAANYAHLIAAEELADHPSRGSDAWASVEHGDMDADGQDEIILNTDKQVLVLKPSYGGALVEWDWRNRRYNLLNTMTRRLESYHQTLRNAAQQGRVTLPGQGEIPRGVRVKDPDVQTRLFYDWYRRVALLDHFLHLDTTPEGFYQARYGEQGDFVNQPYTARVKHRENEVQVTLARNGTVWAGEIPLSVRVQKTIMVKSGSSQVQARYRVVNLDDIPTNLRFGIELNWGIVGGDSPRSYLEVESQRRDLDDFGGDTGVSALAIGSTLPDLAGEVQLALDRAANLWHFPLEVVSNSEAGYERIYQGTCTFLWWDVLLEPGRPWKANLTFCLNQLGQ